MLSTFPQRIRSEVMRNFSQKKKKKKKEKLSRYLYKGCSNKKEEISLAIGEKIKFNFINFYQNKELNKTKNKL